MSTPTKRIALNLGGGYVPGLNCAIRGAVLAASELGWEVAGIRDGFDGLLFPDGYAEGGLVNLSREFVENLSTHRRWGSGGVQGGVMQKSIRALKSWLFTPGNKSDRFSRAAEVHADVLIIDLEDAVTPTAKREARDAAIEYLAALPTDHLPCALRVNSPTAKVGLDDLHALLSSSARPDYLVVPKCSSSALVGLIHGLLREGGKPTEVIALIETAKAVEELEEILGGETKPVALLFGAADMAADLGAETAWEPLLWISRELSKRLQLPESRF